MSLTGLCTSSDNLWCSWRRHVPLGGRLRRRRCPHAPCPPPPHTHTPSFSTFRKRPTIVSEEAYLSDRQSLERMLSDFARDHERRTGGGHAAGTGGNASTSGAATSGTAASAGGASSAASGQEGGDAALLDGMDVVMRCYEQELKRPVR